MHVTKLVLVTGGALAIITGMVVSGPVHKDDKPVPVATSSIFEPFSAPVKSTTLPLNFENGSYDIVKRSQYIKHFFCERVYSFSSSAFLSV